MQDRTSLAASSLYKALTCCWGDASDTRPVVINECTMTVTVNLESALRQFRGKGDGWLWIDAVFINQSDLREKGEGRTSLENGRYFFKGNRGCSLAGLEEDVSELAIKFIRTFGEHAAEILSKEPMLD